MSSSAFRIKLAYAEPTYLSSALIHSTLKGKQTVKTKHETTVNNGVCDKQAKWAALVDDVVIPSPQREVRINVLKSQAVIGDEFVLVRDHNSPLDVVLDDKGKVDLAEGNVFYRLTRHQVRPRDGCTSPPKLAYFVNDRAEITINPNQSGKTLRELFSLSPDVVLFRDFESPNDEAIESNDEVLFRCDSPPLSDSGGGRIMVPEGVPKDEFSRAGSVAAEAAV
jgi:hypothetical protein